MYEYNNTYITYVCIVILRNVRDYRQEIILIKMCCLIKKLNCKTFYWIQENYWTIETYKKVKMMCCGILVVFARSPTCRKLLEISVK